MSGPGDGSLFEVTLPGGCAGEDALGVWQSTPGQPAAAESFAAPAVEPVQLWQARLPANPAAARQALFFQERRLSAAEDALPRAERRLRRFIRQYTTAPTGYESAALTVPPLLGPERELLAWVELARRADHAEPYAAQLEYGVMERASLLVPADFVKTAERAWQFFQDARQALQLAAWVETSLDGRKIARTHIRLSGDLHTAWLSCAQTGDNRVGGITAADVEHHTRVLETALRTRIAWARMALLIARGAAELAALFPTCPYLALPAAWKFFQQVIELVQAGRTS